MVGHPPVILQRFGPVGLVVQARHRNVADLQQLRRGEEHHVGRVVIERVDDAAFLDQDRLHAALLQLDAAGEAGGSGADRLRDIESHSQHALDRCVNVFERRWQSFADSFRPLPPYPGVRRPCRRRPRDCAGQFAGVDFRGQILGDG